MGVVKRQSIKTSLVSYVGVLLGAFNTLWMYPSFLTTEEIGLIATLTNISLLIAPVAQLGVNGIIIKYYPYVKNDPEKLKAFHFFIFIIPVIGFITSMLLLFLCRNLVINSFIENSKLLVDYLFALVPFTFVLVGRNISDTLARAQFRITKPKLYKEVHLRVYVFCIILLYYFYQLSLDFIVYGIIGAFGLNFLVMLFYLRKLQPISMRFSLKKLPRNMIKESLKYGLYIILSGFAGMVVTKIDGYMISTELGLSNAGIYTIALYIGLVIEMPKRSLNLISLPIIGEAMKNKDTAQVEELYKKSALIQLIIGSILLICVWVNIDQLFQLIPNSEEFSQGKYVVLFIGLALLFDMATGVNNEIILMSNFYRWNLIIMTILIVLAIANNFWLIPIYGITGAAMASAISIFIFNIIKFILVWTKLKIQPFSNKTIQALSIIILTLIIGLNLPLSHIPVFDILYRSIILIGIYLILNYRFKTSSDLLKLVNQLLSKLKKGI